MYYKDTDDYPPYDITNPESCKENIADEFAKRGIVFLIDPEKV